MGRELRKTLCVLMAAITLSSSIELPARASEPAGEVQETADSEKTVLAEELDEEEEKGSTEQPACDIVNETQTQVPVKCIGRDLLLFGRASWIHQKPHRSAQCLLTVAAWRRWICPILTQAM